MYHLMGMIISDRCEKNPSITDTKDHAETDPNFFAGVW